MYFNESDVQYAEFQMWKHRCLAAKRRGKELPEPPEWLRAKLKERGLLNHGNRKNKYRNSFSGSYGMGWLWQ